MQRQMRVSGTFYSVNIVYFKSLCWDRIAGEKWTENRPARNVAQIVGQYCQSMEWLLRKTLSKQCEPSVPPLNKCWNG